MKLIYLNLDMEVVEYVCKAINFLDDSNIEVVNDDDSIEVLDDVYSIVRVVSY